MDPQKIERLKEEHQKSLQMCLEKTKQWEKLKTDYETLKQRLETFPDKLSYDVTVPFGPNAFTMGRIVHTNEVMVLLGDNWFAEVSSKQASEISNRRIEQCSKMLIDLKKEKMQFENWLCYIGEVVGNEELVEIVETYYPEEEKKWREQHLKNVQAHHKKLANERKSAEKTAATDEYLHILNHLEIEENSQLGIDRGNSECLTRCSQSSDSTCYNYCNVGKTMSESETCEENETKEDYVISDFRMCNCTGNDIKHVRWQDLAKQNIKTITFKHSKTKNKLSSSMHFQDSNTQQPQILSPSDIYKHFSSLFQVASPKSILKIKTPSVEDSNPFFPTEETKISTESIYKTADPAFTGEVFEHLISKNIATENTALRPASRFKSSRKNRRK